MKQILIMMLVLSMLAVPVLGAPEQKETGFEKYLMQKYGLDLIDMQISDKYNVGENNDARFYVLDIIVSDGSNLYTLTWIMTDERYKEMSEKV